MKICVGSDRLAEGVRRVQSVVSGRSTIPVLSNILLTAQDNGLTLAATDLEVRIETTVEATVEVSGQATLPAKRFGQIATKLPSGTVTIDTNEDLLSTISCGRSQFKVPGMDPAEFPGQDDIAEERRITFPRLAFMRILRKIHYAVSTDQTRYVLSGLLLSVREGNFTAVATDGRRLALVERLLDNAEGVEDGDCILPIKAVHELQRVLEGEGEVAIRVGESQVAFEMGETTLTTKLVDGNYPNYRQVIPQSFRNSCMLPREAFATVLDRVAIVIGDSGGSIKFNLEKDLLTLSTSSLEGEAEEPIELSYDEDPVNIAFNPQFLMEPLRNLDCDELTLRFNDEFKPVVLLGDEGFLYVIMPMRN